MILVFSETLYAHMPFAGETAYSQGKRKRDRRRKTVRIDDHSSKFPVRACELMQSRKR